MKKHYISSLFIISFLLLSQAFITHATTPVWSPVGTVGFSDGNANYTSLALDSHGTPYVAYRDDGHGYKATVMKYVGSTTRSGWAPVGEVGFSDGNAPYTSLALDSHGTPYVAFRDDGHDSKATVMKYVGSTTRSGWAPVGEVGFSDGGAEYTSLALDSHGTPYVAYTDDGHDYKATVMKYVGSTTTSGWAPVGEVGFSDGGAYFTSLALDSHNIPYVSYQNDNTGFGTVMKYVGDATTSGWEPLGGFDFTSSSASFPSPAFDSHDNLFLAFGGGSYEGKTSVLEYPAVIVPTPTPTTRHHSSGGTSPSSRISNLLNQGNREGALAFLEQYPGARASLSGEVLAQLGLGNNQVLTAEANSAQVYPESHATSTYQFLRNLELGSTGDDVIQLQKFLNTHGFVIALTGAGSLNHETNRFGTLTKLSLIKYQKSKSITPAAGYFGTVTRGVVNRGE